MREINSLGLSDRWCLVKGLGQEWYLAGYRGVIIGTGDLGRRWDIPVNKKQGSDVGLILVQRRRRWSNINPTSDRQDNVWAVTHPSKHQPTLVYRWTSVVDVGPALNLHWDNISCELLFLWIFDRSISLYICFFCLSITQINGHPSIPANTKH